MTPFNLYKHINNTDVAIMPMEISFDATTDSYDIKVRWINIVLKRNLDMDIIQTIKIKKADMENWKLYGA